MGKRRTEREERAREQGEGENAEGRVLPTMPEQHKTPLKTWPPSPAGLTG